MIYLIDLNHELLPSLPLYFFDFFDKGVIHKVRSLWRGEGRASSKIKRKRTGGEGIKPIFMLTLWKQLPDFSHSK